MIIMTNLLVIQFIYIMKQNPNAIYTFTGVSQALPVNTNKMVKMIKKNNVYWIV